MKILCIHQGYELYGSDRTFLQSILAIRDKFPSAFISVKLPMKGLLSELLGNHVNEIIYGDFFVLRKSDIKQKKWKLFYGFPKAIYKAIGFIAKHDATYVNSVVVFDYLIASIFYRKKVILHVHEIPTGFARIVFSALIAMSGAKIIYNSFSTKKSYLFSSDDSEVIYNGVSDACVSVKNKTALGSLKILMIGRFNSWKGQDFLVEVVRQLPSVVSSKISIKIVGSVFEDQIHFKDKVDKLINEFKLDELIKIVSFTKNTTPLYEWADVVIVPSLKPEPFGLVAIEAMASGCAVVAANHGGLSEIVVHNETGVLFEPGSHDALAVAISFYVENRDKVISHGIAGKMRHKKYFSEDSYFDAIKNIF